jgi:DNA polymerase-3 subunit alpha
LDGLSKPKQIANRCLKIGATSCAITDHGSIAGAVQIYKELRANNIKPILGCELYICKDKASIKNVENSKLTHLLVLAKNYKGWQSLIKIVSASNLADNFYKKPRLDLDSLFDLLDGNIMGLAGHLGSTLEHELSTATDISKSGSELIARMKDGFGSDNFFLEAQLIDSHYTPKQIELTEHIRRLGTITKTKVVCTPDAHYAESADAVDQRILLCNNLKLTLTDINRKLINDEDIPMGCFFKSDKYHIPSWEEMKEIHSEEEIENSHYIANLCENYNITSKPILPEYKCPDDMNPDEYLRVLCRNGWKEKIANIIDKDHQNIYVDRIKYELSVLQGAGLSSYFLIVQDIVDYVKRNEWLPGPGRGSAAGCLVSYLIGVTSIDPIKYNLLFDRFYNAGRNTKDHISMPDIDVDVPINKRETVVEYIKNKYGHDKVSQMITFNTMKGRGALKEVLRVYGNISFDEMNNITKHIPDEAKIADELQEMKDETGEASIIRWALENNVDKLKEWCYILEDGSLSGPLAKRFEQAIRLEGTKSNQSKHAAGVVIAQQKLSEICPMVYDTKNKQSIAGMEMQDLEALGVIKFDILGIAMLDKIMNISDILYTEGVDYENSSVL